MAFSPLSYKAKIQATISKLPSIDQPIFQSSLIKRSFNLDTFSFNESDIWNSRSKNSKSRNDHETFFKKYLHNKETAKTFSKDTEVFRNIYNKIKRENQDPNEILHEKQGECNDEVNSYGSNGNDNDQFINENIFLPSIILEKPENINSSISFIDRNEAMKEKDFIKKFSEVMMNKNKNLAHLHNRLLEERNKKKLELQSNKTSNQLYRENRKLLKEIHKSDRTFKSLSELPEYCMTTLDTKNQDIELSNTNNTPSETSFSPRFTKHRSKIVPKDKKLISNNKMTSKIVLSKLYNKLRKNQLSQEHSNIIRYFKNTSQKIEPVNLANGSDLHGLLNDFQKKTNKLNIPEKTAILMHKFGREDGITLGKINKAEAIDKTIQNLHYDHIIELLYK